MAVASAGCGGAAKAGSSAATPKTAPGAVGQSKAAGAAGQAKAAGAAGKPAAAAAGGGRTNGGDGQAQAQTRGGGAPSPAVVAVIRNWSSQLAGGHVAAAATYFATPSLLQVDPSQPGVTLRTRADVVAANQAFPCGAKLVTSRVVGGYVDALFVLGNRPGGGPGGCGAGTGQTARVAFQIKSGRIVEWLRIPNEPGDSAHDRPGAVAPPPAPSGPGSGVSAV